MPPEIPFISPVFPRPAELSKDLEGIIRRNCYTNRGPLELELSAALAEYIGSGVSVALTANATIGLMLAMKQLFLRDRHEVIVQSFTFGAVPQAIMWCGYRPVFIDVCEQTWQANLAEARSYFEANPLKVAGILLCNTFGVGNPQIGEWESFAGEAKIPLVVDSAAGFGSLYEPEEKLGARGDCEVFSFHATKAFAIGEGGAVASRSSEVIDAIRRSSNFGFDNNDEATLPGLNGKLSEISSAIGLRQLHGFDERLEKRRAVLRLYKKRLGPSGVMFQDGSPSSALAFVSATLPNSVDRDSALEAMAAAGVGARAYYNPPAHKQALFRACSTEGALIFTDKICRRIISLPTLENTPDLVDRVCSVILEQI